jgi:AraC-like DNA-binding protein
MQMPLVSAGAVNAWQGYCSERGLTQFAQRKADAGFPADRVPLGDYVQLAEEAAFESGDPCLGWTVGERFDLRELGPLGHAMLGASSLGVALRRLVSFFALVQDATELSLREEDGHCIIGYRILDPGIWPRHQDALFTLSLICQLLRGARLPCWSTVELQLETEEVGGGAEIVRRTGATCLTGCEANMLRLPLDYLALPLHRSEAVVMPDLGQLNRYVSQKRRTTGIELRVRSLIYQHLGARAIDQEDIAGQLGMSSRTLRRRLADIGSSFQQLVDDCRMRQAEHEFRQRRSCSIAQTALRLGYSEHSTFTRAFSRWSGMPPQAFLRSVPARSASGTVG